MCVCVCARATVDTYRHTRPYKANALHEVREIRANRYKQARLSRVTICMKYVPISINKAGCNK